MIGCAMWCIRRTTGTYRTKTKSSGRSICVYIIRNISLKILTVWEKIVLFSDPKILVYFSVMQYLIKIFSGYVTLFLPPDYLIQIGSANEKYTILTRWIER